MKKLAKKVLVVLLCPYFKKIGVLPARIERVSNMFIDDFLNNKSTTLKQKLWAYKRGFVSEQIHRYGLTSHNYKDYMSEIEFYKTKSYKNRGFAYWYDDKLTTWYILQPYKQFLPIHHFSIVKNQIKHHDINSKFENSIKGIIDLLRDRNELALKKTRGGQGDGFFKLTLAEGNDFYINDDKVTQEFLSSFLSGLNNYIITDYLHCHQSLKRIYPKTPNAIRVITIYDDKEEAQVTGAIIRFGSRKTNYVDNLMAGGICAGIDILTGNLFKPVVCKDGKFVPCEFHPDSGVKIEGKIPNWEFITKNVKEISNYLKITPYLSYDIVSTIDGFKILEINSHGMSIQVHYPYFLDKYHKRLFSCNNGCIG